LGDLVNIPPAYAPFVDAVLRSVDPRLSVEERQLGLEQAAGEPEFVIGLLSQLLSEYHDRAEAMAGLTKGTFVDRLRQRAFSGRSPEEILGYAVHAASAGEEIRFVPVDEPRSPADFRRAQHGAAHLHSVERDDGLAPGDSGLRQEPPVRPLSEPHAANTPRPLAEVALEAEAARRGRLEAELMGGATQQGGTYPGSPEVPDATRVSQEAEHDFPVSDFTQNGITPILPGDPRLKGLLDRLNQQRREEQAVDTANPDDPRTMGPAIRAAADLDPTVQEQARPAESPVPGLPGVRTYAPAAPRAASNDGNFTPCGFDTGRGPCALSAGHPELPVPGTVNGHLSEEMGR
jgi:hypothetical protein